MSIPHLLIIQACKYFTKFLYDSAFLDGFGHTSRLGEGNGFLNSGM